MSLLYIARSTSMRTVARTQQSTHSQQHQVASSMRSSNQIHQQSHHLQSQRSLTTSTRTQMSTTSASPSAPQYSTTKIGSYTIEWTPRNKMLGGAFVGLSLMEGIAWMVMGKSKMDHSKRMKAQAAADAAAEEEDEE